MKLAHNGFTLIEVLVAMAIFSISSMAITSLMVTHIKGESLNIQSAEAIALAQDKLEDLRTINYGTVASTGSVTKTRKGVVYTTNWTVQKNVPTTAMSTLTVTVSWNAPGGTKSYETKSIFSSVDIDD